MRITKANLQATLDAAARFNQLRLRIVRNGRRSPTAEEIIRDRYGFVSVCKYTRGMLPLRGEIGTNWRDRYIILDDDIFMVRVDKASVK